MVRRISAVLFDIDVEGFFPDYFARLQRFVAPHAPGHEFLPQLLRSTTAMIANRDPSLTNQEVFLEDFFAGLAVPREKLMPLFDAFYRDEFPALAKHARPVEGARSAVEWTLGSGRRAVVATAPVFPRTAIMERLGWAGLGDLPFAFVTTYENMHFCKPHPEYYAEIAGHLGCPAEECLMVGNDVEEDLPAQDVGMATFLAGPAVIHRGRRPAKPDYRGVLADLPRVLGEMPHLT